MSDCTECNGTGEIDLSLRAERIVECEACGGSGEVTSDDEVAQIVTDLMHLQEKVYGQEIAQTPAEPPVPCKDCHNGACFEHGVGEPAHPIDEGEAHDLFSAVRFHRDEGTTVGERLNMCDEAIRIAPLTPQSIAQTVNLSTSAWPFSDMLAVVCVMAERGVTAGGECLDANGQRKEQTSRVGLALRAVASRGLSPSDIFEASCVDNVFDLAGRAGAEMTHVWSAGRETYEETRQKLLEAASE